MDKKEDKWGFATAEQANKILHVINSLQQMGIIEEGNSGDVFDDRDDYDILLERYIKLGKENKRLKAKIKKMENK